MKLWVALAIALSLPLSASAQQPKSAILFRNVDVFDGSRMIRHTNVFVRDGMIRAVGPVDGTTTQSAQVIDGAGKTLLPGLFDAHTHLGQFRIEPFLKDALEFGVTTELEMWGSAPSLALSKKIQANQDPNDLNMADFCTAGIGVTAPHGHPTQMMGTSEPLPTLAPGDDAQAFVDARIAEGSDYIKIIDEHMFPTLTR